MKPQVEAAIRTVLKADTEIDPAKAEAAIALIKGDLDDPINPLHAIPYKELFQISGLPRVTIEKYIQLGVLDRAYSPRRRLAIGVTRKSYYRLTSRQSKNWPSELEAKVRSKIHLFQAH